jgi:hypothetical protein
MILIAWPLLCVMTLVESVVGLWVSTIATRNTRVLVCMGYLALATVDHCLAIHVSIGTLASGAYWYFLRRGDGLAVMRETKAPSENPPRFKFSLSTFFLLVSLQCVLLASPAMISPELQGVVTLPIGLVGVNVVAIRQSLTNGDECSQFLVVIAVTIFLGAGAAFNASTDARMIALLTLVGAIHAGWVFRFGSAFRAATGYGLFRRVP